MQRKFTLISPALTFSLWSVQLTSAERAAAAAAAVELHRGASLTHTALPKQGRVQLRCLCPLAQEALRFDDFKARREQAARCLHGIAGPVPLLAAGRAGGGV